jgi:two-component system response regulator HydG
MEKVNARILIIDDDTDILLAAKMFLRKYFKIIHTEKNPENIPDLLRNDTYDVILLDMNFSRGASTGKEGFYWLNKILEIDPAAIVIFITGYGDIELAVQGIKEGATNFILKPWENKKLLATIEASLKIRVSKVELENLRSTNKLLVADQDHVFSNIIGQSKAMEKVLKTVEKVAKTDANVLILGENGTGKEVIARAIHRASHRKDQMFINVDLGAITESLFGLKLLMKFIKNNQDFIW